MSSIRELQTLLSVQRTVKRIGDVKRVVKQGAFVTVNGKPEFLPSMSTGLKPGDRVSIQDGVIVSRLTKKAKVNVYNV